MKPIYNRVLLKISGEALAGEQHFGINEAMTQKVAKEVKQIHDLGVQVAIVVGGGNFWRGRTSKDMDRATADYQSSDFHRNERDRRTVCEAQGAEPAGTWRYRHLWSRNGQSVLLDRYYGCSQSCRDGCGDNIAG